MTINQKKIVTLANHFGFDTYIFSDSTKNGYVYGSGFRPPIVLYNNSTVLVRLAMRAETNSGSINTLAIVTPSLAMYMAALPDPELESQALEFAFTL